MNAENWKKNDLNEILERIISLEERIASLESNNKPAYITKRDSSEKSEEVDSDYVNVNLSLSVPFETNVGEYGLAWLGNIVLFFAIAFLWQYFNNVGKPLISLIAGLISVTGVFTLSYYFRKSYTYLSFTFRLFGFIILYYILLRLHYFNKNPLVANQAIATFLLLGVVGAQLFYAVRVKSEFMAGLAFVLALIAAFIHYHKYPFMIISMVTTGMVLYSFWKYNWWKSLVFLICAGFFINLIWLLKNPVSLVITPEDPIYQHAFVYFSIITAIHSLVTFRKPNSTYPENLILTIILLSGLTYSVLLLVLVLLHFPSAFVSFFIAISIYCIFYSVILKFYSPWKYAPALYALYGFVAISVAVFGTYHFPDSFLLLIIQSFLVLTVALWYKSHIITLMNTFLLLILAIFYYKTSGTLYTVNFSIPIVAFLSARIINWQRKRLNIKTDLIRNIYLFLLFFSLLFATYKAIPGQYITVSWLLIAGIYFSLSIALKNFKYRWMAMANIVISAFHIFLVDLAKVELKFRILAFLLFAIISIIISTYYVRKLKKEASKNMAENTVELTGLNNEPEE